jgi:hypothetical protein
MNRDGGKGDTPRPLSVSMEEFDKNFDAIFGKKSELKPKAVDFELEVENDEQEVKVIKTWEL